MCRFIMKLGEEHVTSSKKWVRVTHLVKGYFYVGCRFILISYFFTKFNEKQDVTFYEGDQH